MIIIGRRRRRKKWVSPSLSMMTNGKRQSSLTMREDKRTVKWSSFLMFSSYLLMISPSRTYAILEWNHLRLSKSSFKNSINRTWPGGNSSLRAPVWVSIGVQMRSVKFSDWQTFATYRCLFFRNWFDTNAFWTFLICPQKSISKLQRTSNID